MNEGFVSRHKFWVRRSNLSFLQVAVAVEEAEVGGGADRKGGTFWWATDRLILGATD